MKTNYRPDIDGLRAIAVISFIFYTSKISLFSQVVFKGGFLGIDFFFIISGYLITSLILKDLFYKNQFSVLKFYKNRLLRILPIKLVVIAACMPFAWLYLLPNDLINFSRTIISSLTFSSNFYFWIIGKSFLDTSVFLEPLFHNWSISIVEQFYLCAPIFLLLVIKFFRSSLIYFLFIIFIFSIYISHWSSVNLATLNFYFLPTRIWEFSIGSILAYIEIKRGYRSNNLFVNQIMSLIGLVLIIFSIFFINDYFLYPSLFTLAPLTGISLIIWFSNKNELVCKILSCRFLVFFGLISYSLYLWHYPIFSFFRVTGYLTEANLIFKIILLLITVILSIISYYLIEKPMKNFAKLKFIYFILLSTFITIIFIAFYFISNEGLKNRLPNILLKGHAEKSWLKHRDDKGTICLNKKDTFCTHNSNGKKGNIFIIGDSVTATHSHDLKKRLVKEDYSLTSILKGGYWYLPNFNRFNIKLNKIDKNLTYKYQNKIRHKLINSNKSTIIIGGRLQLYSTLEHFDNSEGGKGIDAINSDNWEFKYIARYSEDSFHTSVRDSILELSNLGHKIILVYPIPEVGWDVPRKLFSKRKIIKSKYITTSYNVFKKRTKKAFEILDSIKGENILRVYPHKLFCDNLIKDRCIAHDDSKLFYSDATHPSLEAANLINDLIVKKIQ
tara:strand:- start:695 stop:2704 length:2010 start_codon:yes stop_codon:yes gene_type:complete